MIHPTIWNVPLGAFLAETSSTSNASTSTEFLALLAGYFLLILLGFFGLVMMVQIARGKIDMRELLGEFGGGASMSRFQLLIFTFVVAFSLVMLVATTGKLPEIPTGLLALLGISGSTYAVSKGIQATMPGGLATKADPDMAPGNESGAAHSGQKPAGGK